MLRTWEQVIFLDSSSSSSVYFTHAHSLHPLLTLIPTHIITRNDSLCFIILFYEGLVLSLRQNSAVLSILFLSIYKKFQNEVRKNFNLFKLIINELKLISDRSFSSSFQCRLLLVLKSQLLDRHSNAPLRTASFHLPIWTTRNLRRWFLKIRAAFLPWNSLHVKWRKFQIQPLINFRHCCVWWWQLLDLAH